MQTLVFNGIEGKTFRGKLFKPLKTNGVVMIICPATCVKQRYYFNFANYLAEIGYTVITFDYQGIGESRPKNLRKFQCSATDWYENNLTQVIQYAKQQLNPDKLLLTGHSIGGQLIGLCEASKYADGIVLVGSQMGYWKLWPPRLRARMWFNWYVLVPSFTFIFGYLPAKKLGIMEDLPKEAAREWASWCRSPNHFLITNREQRIPSNLLEFLSSPIVFLTITTRLKTPLIFYCRSMKTAP